MVWMINKLSGWQHFSEVNKDVIYQCTNVMFSVYQKDYDVYQVYALWCCGVNIFNVDLTIHGETLFNEIKDIVGSAQQLYKPDFYRPIAVSVTVSVKKPFEIDEKVDFIVLKDVESKEEFVKYKRGLKDQSTPILLMITNCDLPDFWFLIKGKLMVFKEGKASGYIVYEDRDVESLCFDDGVLLNIPSDTNLEFDLCEDVLKLCREGHKPVFLSKPNMLKDYDAKDRRVMIMASQIVKHRLDGIVIEDCVEAERSEDLTRALVTSMRYLEGGIDAALEVSSLSKRLHIPVLPPLSAAAAASLAALKSGASVIMLLTASGRSAKWISKASPPCHVLAITTKDSTARRMHMYRMVIPLLYTKRRAADWLEECSSRVRFGTNFALATAICSQGAKLVVMAPSDEGSGYCNSFSLLTVPYRCGDS